MGAQRSAAGVLQPYLWRMCRREDSPHRPLAGSAVLTDDPPSEKTVRDSVKRLRETAARLSDRLKRSSVTIATLDDAENHPERAARGTAMAKAKRS